MYDNAPSMENFLNSFSGSKLPSGYALFSSVARSMRVHSKKPMGEVKPSMHGEISKILSFSVLQCILARNRIFSDF